MATAVERHGTEILQKGWIEKTYQQITLLGITITMSNNNQDMNNTNSIGRGGGSGDGNGRGNSNNNNNILYNNPKL